MIPNFTLLGRTMLLFLFFFHAFSPSSEASHGMGADLSFTCVGANQYELTLQLYRDCAGISAPTSTLININSASCGQSLSVTLTQASSSEASPLCPSQISQSTCNGGTLQGVEVYTYTGTVTLPTQCTDWVMSYRLGNRNSAITNITTPGSAFMYVETQLNNLDVSCNNSPTFTTPPVPYICNGVPFSYNHGVIDAEGDSLAFSLIAPLDNVGAAVNFVAPFNASQPMATSGVYGFDPLTGQMTFTPNGVQNAVIAVEVREYRNGVLISRSIRDMQIVVINCTNNVPVVNPIAGLTGASQSGNIISTCEGSVVNFSITATDADIDNIDIIETVSANLPGSVVVINDGTHPASIDVTWTVPPGALSSYTFTATFSDGACPTPGFQIVGYSIQLPSIRLDGDGEYCPPNENISLAATPNGSGTGSYSWSPAGGLSCTNCPNPTATVSSPTTYNVTFTDGATGCTATNSVFVDEHTMNLSISGAPADWCAGDPPFDMRAELNADPGTTITPSTTFYDVNSIPYNDIPIGGTVVGLGDDAVTTAEPIGFSFEFFGTTFTDFFISSNGYILFGSTLSGTSLSEQVLPNTAAPNNLIALFWEDLDPGNGGQPAINEIRYQTVGSAPNRTLVVEYDAVDHFSAGDNVTGQIHLHETTNCIETHVFVQPQSQAHTLGIENAAGTIGYSPPSRNGVIWTVAVPEAWEFCPGNDTVGTGITYLWSSGAGVSNANTQEPTFNPPASPTSYDVTADDGICQITESVNISCILLGADCEMFDLVLNQNNESITLDWSTTEEEHNAGFFIERSTDGVNYTRLNWVASYGNSTEGHQYNYVDDDALIKGVRYYYRLLQMDQDGMEQSFCEVKTLQIPGEFVNDLSIQPNPTTSDIEVVFDASKSGKIQIRVFDVLGQLVLDAGMHPMQSGRNRYPISLDKLAPATYFIQVGDDELGYKSIEKVVKTK